MTYRNDVEALEARKTALELDVAQKQRELEDAAQLLREAKTRASLPVLENLRVASPCTMPWDQMTGDERVRHCGKCDKDVFNLSAMTREAAEQLILANNGDLCARYYQRKDGTILLADCLVGRSQRRKRRWVAAGAAAILAGGGGLAAFERLRETPAAHDFEVIQGPAIPLSDVEILEMREWTTAALKVEHPDNGVHEAVDGPAVQRDPDDPRR